MHFKENTLFDLELEMQLQEIHSLTLIFVSKSNEMFAQCTLHHVTYTLVKFEVTTFNGLGGEAFTWKYIN